MSPAARLVALLSLLYSTSPASAQIECRNRRGDPVDWWLSIKFPGGGTYAYIDAHSKVSNASFEWHVMYGLDEPTGSALASTLQQLYPQSEGIGYAMWNDEFPSGLFWLAGAHAKGVAAFDAFQGFWLLHSVPKFPLAPCQNCSDGSVGYSGIAPPQKVYGQSALCVTAAAAQIDSAARVAQTSGVYIYDFHLPQRLRGLHPAVEALMVSAPYGRPSIVPGAPAAVAGNQITSLGGSTFTLFAKAPSAAPLPLYEGLVAPFLRSAMVWETWQHGDNLPQDCGSPDGTRWSSFTISALDVPSGAQWTVGQDHAKWGITSVSAPSCCHLPPRGSPLGNVVCFGDMNRQWHQNFRGGGAICLMGNDALWRAFSSSIKALEPCPAAATL